MPKRYIHERRKQDAGGYYRKYNGKKFHLYSTHAKKTDAKTRAKNLRKDGGKARVVKCGKRWEVYTGK